MEPTLQRNRMTEPGGRQTLTDEYFELKSKIHDRLLDLVDLSKLDRMDPSILKPELRKVVDKILQDEHRSVPLNAGERERLHGEILDEVLGFGPLEPLLQDPTVSDILVNTYRHVYVERFGKIESTDVRFKDDAHLRRIIDKIVTAVGRRIDEIVAHGGRKAAGRLARQCGHPAPVPGRAHSVDPALFRGPARTGRPDPVQDPYPADRRAASGHRQIAFEHPDRGGHGQRQNHAS